MIVEAAVAAPLLIGVLLISVWFTALYSAKIDSVIAARAKTMDFASHSCPSGGVTDGTPGQEDIGKWLDTDSSGLGASVNDVLAASKTEAITGCSEEAKQYNVGKVTVTKNAVMPIGKDKGGTGFLGGREFKATSYAMCNPAPQTDKGISQLPQSVDSLVGTVMGH